MDYHTARGGGEVMKIVTIPIKVEVSDNAKQVAVDENGEVWSHEYKNMRPNGKDDSGLGIWRATGPGSERCRVLNWEDTLIEVK
jgi:hypothetical protein